MMVFKADQATRFVNNVSSPRVAEWPLLRLHHRFPRFLPASSHIIIGYKRLPPLAIATTAAGNPSLLLHENIPSRLATTYATLSCTRGG
jgi:hypothetical protein